MHTKLFLEEVTHPEVVVACDVMNRDAPVGKRLQGGQSPVKPLRNNRGVFEPEIKQIPEDAQLPGLWKDPLEKRQQTVFFLALRLPIAQSKMHIGNEVDWHVSIYEKAARK